MKQFFRFIRLIRIGSVLIYCFLMSRQHLNRGDRLCKVLEMLGPIFIKAGQLLSTRRDLLPDDIARSLERLQDQVAPFDGQMAEKMMTQALGAPLSVFFQSVDLNALASASVAQVHAAVRRDGQPVVIKVLRPNVHYMIDRDLDVLFFLADLIERFSPEYRRFKPRALVAEIASTLHDELDLQREAANASQLKRNFASSSLLHIPKIDWQLSRPNMLVMERIDGIPIYQTDTLRSAGYNMEKLAHSLVDVFFTQVFRDSFFHADMHPGNIFVLKGSFEAPKLCFVDFGMMGSLNTRDQRYLAENLLAFFKRNYQRVAELHIASGWVPPDTRIDQFEGDIRAVCEPMFERPAIEMSFGELLLRLFQTARRYRINIQPQLILLQKTLLNIEGVARQLHPSIDLWKTAAPFLERWIKQQMGIPAFFRRLKDNLPYWSEKLPEIPGLVYDILEQLRDENEKRRFRYEDKNR